MAELSPKRSDSPSPPLSSSFFSSELQLYCRIEIESKIIEKQLREHYARFGDVRFKINPDDEVLTAELYKDTKSSFPIVEVWWQEWAAELILPDAIHFYGPGSFAEVSASDGIHEFLYERKSLNPLALNSDQAKGAFKKLSTIDCQFYKNQISWEGLENFRLLIYRMLETSETDFLLQQFGESLERDGSIPHRLLHGLKRTMLHLYMIGAHTAEYSDNYFHNKEQGYFNAFFAKRGLGLPLGPESRIAALKQLFETTKDEFVSEALVAAKDFYRTQQS